MTAGRLVATQKSASLRLRHTPCEVLLSDTLPSHVRPIAFLGGELVLELLFLLQSHYRLDLDSILVLLCVSDATMRPLMQKVDDDPSLLDIARPSEALRGSISRMMVADKTGLPRETVRRKAIALVSRGYLIIDSDGGLRTETTLSDKALQTMLEKSHTAIARYTARADAYGIINIPQGRGSRKIRS